MKTRTAPYSQMMRLCEELYKYQIRPDASILTITNRDHGKASISKVEVDNAVRSIKAGKSPDTDNVPTNFWLSRTYEGTNNHLQLNMENETVVKRMDIILDNIHPQDRKSKAL